MRRALARSQPILGEPAQPRLWLLGLALAALVWLGPTRLGAATFTATLDRPTVTVGESATLTLQFEGGDPKSIPAPPNLPGLQIADTGLSQNVSIIGGNVSRTVSESYVLTPTQPGNYTIPALQAEVGGQVLRSRPLTLKAVKVAASDQLAFFRLEVPKKAVYLGEAITVELQVYIREGVANAEGILRQFDAYSGCPITADGFNILKTAHAQRQRVRVGSGIYGLSTLVTSLTPVKTGPLTINSMNVTLPLQLPVQGQSRQNSLFDPFGMFQQYQEKRLTLVADPVTVTALPLPKTGVPPTFNGAVGSFALALSAGPTNVAVGDPVTARIQISGRGPLESLVLPDQPAWKEFKAYPPTTKLDTSDPLGLQGTKTFEQVVTPESADLKELPPVTFSFFDPAQKQYRTLTQPGVPLIVRPAGAAPAPVILATSRQAQDNPPPAQSIVEIKQRLGAVAQLGPPLVLRPGFVALQGVPLLAFVFALVWRKRSEMLANNPRLRRQRQVAQVVRDGLNELHGLAAANKSDEFFALVVRLLQEQLGERLDLPASAITEAVIEERLRPLGVPDSTLTPLQELFQACNLARYAPVQNSQELAAFVPRLDSVLRQVQEVKA